MIRSTNGVVNADLEELFTRLRGRSNALFSSLKA